MCPQCQHSLQQTHGGAKCGGCGLQYRYMNSGALDLRLQKPQKYSLEFELGLPLLQYPDCVFAPLLPNPMPQVDYSGMATPNHLSGTMLSHFPRAEGTSSLALDLGCGDAVHRDVCERAGFHYVGLDYESPSAQILGDAHSLPFCDNSFEFILSTAVLEHIQFPFVMVKEAFRVLVPHGKFIGTVAFLQPFHSRSFYHHTHLGLLNTLQYGGFTVEHIVPSATYSVFVAQARMTNPFPGMPKSLSRCLVVLPHVLSNVWWTIGRLANRGVTRHSHVLSTTGALTFMCRKPGD